MSRHSSRTRTGCHVSCRLDVKRPGLSRYRDGQLDAARHVDALGCEAACHLSAVASWPWASRDFAPPGDAATATCRGRPRWPATSACRAGLERLALAAVETDRGGRVAKARTAEYPRVPSRTLEHPG